MSTPSHLRKGACKLGAVRKGTGLLTVQAENTLVLDNMLDSLLRTFESRSLVLETNLDKLERNHLRTTTIG
jgi:hypothetical protein